MSESGSQIIFELKERVLRLEYEQLRLLDQSQKIESRLTGELQQFRDQVKRLEEGRLTAHNASQQLESGEYRKDLGWERGHWELGRGTSHKGVRSHDGLITFAQPFKGPPKVFLAFSKLDTASRPLRVDVTAHEITKCGFKLRISTWEEESEVYGINVQWLAYSFPFDGR